ncbi:MAG TPA: NeuD/PglB/VioB family sugar acetyltransferase [Lacunisphaera sp.]|nr:NeuD/PglB/VioB family sugar acetyltransferase [Lacunisphaera sp.]
MIGAGGHAKVVFDALRCACPGMGVLVRDDDPQAPERHFFDPRPLTPIEFRAGEPMLVHVAIGHNETRRGLTECATRHARPAFTILHPRSVVAADASIGGGTFVAAGAVIAPEVVIGRAAIINHSAVVDHDCRIDDYAHIAPRAVLGGGVRVGAGVLIGAGAVVLPGCTIGAGAIVGAGAVVRHQVAANTVVVGNPAKLLRYHV